VELPFPAAPAAAADWPVVAPVPVPAAPDWAAAVPPAPLAASNATSAPLTSWMLAIPAARNPGGWAAWPSRVRPIVRLAAEPAGNAPAARRSHEPLLATTGWYSPDLYSLGSRSVAATK
jgi:hypothetical protein